MPSYTCLIYVHVFIRQRSEVQLEVEARDQGAPSKSSFVRLDVEITQTVNVYPQWERDYTGMVARVSESAPVNTAVMRLKATSGIPDSLVNYFIQHGVGTVHSYVHLDSTIWLYVCNYIYCRSILLFVLLLAICFMYSRKTPLLK